ncbi:MAG: hypothetical protein RL223_785 [Pseudomonadota bacterium]|jgi:predicted metal-dependent enzyme (double-stranded beta helix superfamily)
MSRLTQEAVPDIPRPAVPGRSTVRLRTFIATLTRAVERHAAAPVPGAADEAALLATLRPALAALVAHDDWLPDGLATPDPRRYRQVLLHADPLERCSVVAFVWGPGQRTPVHDHTVWGLIGMLRGAETEQAWRPDAQGRLQPHGPPHTLCPGEVATLLPATGDVHQVANASTEVPAISIHVYGANIGAVRRSVWEADGTRRPFISGYSNPWVPNLWDRSLELSA